MLREDDGYTTISGLPAPNEGRRSLILSPKEEAVILGLAVHTDLNNQQIQSIFSHLERTINHREIGFIRQRQGRYSQLRPASKAKVDEFMQLYGKLVIELRRLGIVPSARRDELGILAQQAMLAAIAVFNTPCITFKSEMFIVNICISWTYLLHAYFLDQDIDIVYRNKKGHVAKTRHGQDKFIDLDGCLAHQDCPLDGGTKNNLYFLLAIRHEIEHRGCDRIDQFLSPKFQANCLNFDHYSRDLLGEEFEIASKLPFSVQMSDFAYDRDARSKKEQLLPSELVVVHEAFEKSLTDEEYNDPRYAFRVHILPRTANRKGGADEVLQIATTDEDVSKVAHVLLKHSEKPKYYQREVLDYIHQRGYPRFNSHHFQEFWKSIAAKKAGNGFGVWIKKQWFWYETIFEPTLKHCEMSGDLYREIGLQ